MKKKLSCILLSCITLICAFTFASCEKKNGGEADITPPDPLAPPITWLYFDCIDDAVSFLNTKDSSYITNGRATFESKKFEEGYNHTIQEFEKDGYILYATSSVAETDKELSIIPLYNLEDVGVRYVFNWDDRQLRVFISTIDDSKAMDFKADSPCSYLLERNGYTNYVDMQKEVDGQMMNLSVSTTYLSDLTSIMYFLDSRHYVNVVSYSKELTQEDILNFIGTLNFEKIYFNEEN